MKPRHQVMDLSVQLEFNISTFLKVYLNIKNEDSKSFDRSNSLSFQQKLNLILDMKLLEKEQIKKLELFGQIRNKFAHKLEIETFFDCFNSNDDLKKRLLNLYNNKIEPKDEQEYFSIFNSLVADIAIIGFLLIGKIKPFN